MSTSTGDGNDTINEMHMVIFNLKFPFHTIFSCLKCVLWVSVTRWSLVFFLLLLNPASVALLYPLCFYAQKLCATLWRTGGYVMEGLLWLATRGGGMALVSLWPFSWCTSSIFAKGGGVLQSVPGHLSKIGGPPQATLWPLKPGEPDVTLNWTFNPLGFRV